MSLQEFGSVVRSRRALRGTGIVLGALMLFGGAAHAAPTLRLAQTGDVVVPTEPAGGTTGGTTGGTGGTGGTTTTPPLNTIRFACQSSGGVPTVMYMPESQPNQSYAWAVPTNMGGGWSADRRCSEISRRLESYRPDGLIEMKTAVENGYNTICVTTERVPSCRIVLTVPQGQDPVATRDRVFQNLTIADSGQSTQGVVTFAEGGRSNNILGQLGQVLGIGGKPSGLGTTTKPLMRSRDIDLRPFLDRKDGGTGERLIGGTVNQPRSTGKKLKPGLFR
jgi:Circadian oscillating protein COP23